MPEQVKKIQPRLRAAQFVENSFNEENYTIDVVAATDAEVLQIGWEGLIREVLGMETSEVRLDRLNQGANIIDNHNRYGSVTKVVLGVVERAWIKGGQLHATVRLSRRKELEEFIQDVRDGIIRNISIGYNVYEYLIEEKVDQVPLYRATDWEPFEISFVPVPADYLASTRNNKQYENPIDVKIISNSNQRNMPETKETGAAATEQTRSASTEAVTETGTTTTTTTVDVEQERSAGANAANQRSVGILSAVRAAGLGVEYAETLIADSKISLDKAREMVLAKLAEGQSQAQTRGANATVVGDDEQVKERSAVEFAMLNRAAPSLYPIGQQNNAASVLAANFRGISVLGAIETLLQQRGMKVNRFNKQELYERGMTTSDFPALMSNVANKILRKEYDETPQTFKALATQQNLPDFKESTGIQFGGDAKFEEVKEGSEIKYGSFVETKDGWKLSTYAKIFKMSRQMIINDDLAAFVRVARLIARGAKNNESRVFWALITGNVKLGDNVALFHTATHKNLASSGAALDATTMNAARTAMRRQVGLTDEELISITPKYIVVAPEQEMAADQLLTNITPSQTGQVNPFTSAGLQKIVEPRLPAGPWYVFADPATVDMATYGYLEGNEGLYTESRYGFEVDGIEIKARQDFGAKWWDHRGTYKNPGA